MDILVSLCKTFPYAPATRAVRCRRHPSRCCLFMSKVAPVNIKWGSTCVDALVSLPFDIMLGLRCGEQLIEERYGFPSGRIHVERYSACVGCVAHLVDAELVINVRRVSCGKYTGFATASIDRRAAEERGGVEEGLRELSFQNQHEAVGQRAGSGISVRMHW